MRFGIVNIAPSGQDILFSVDRIEVGRNFCNKLWNAARFRQMSGDTADNSSEEAIIGRMNPDQLSAYDHWILSRLLETTADVERCFEKFEVHAYPHALYDFFWNDYCDWYVEASKGRMKDPATQETVLAVQDLVMRQVLMLLQPIVPFISEELWQNLGYAKDDSAFLQDSRLPLASELTAWLEAKAGSLDTDARAEI